MTINNALKVLREYHGLKQNEVADRLGYHKSVVSSLESGKRPAGLEVIKRYAEAFKIPASSVILLAELQDTPDDDHDAKSTPRRYVADKVFKILDWINDKTALDENP